ncbi:MAG: SAM domain-containing protein, partial [Geminicoccaceae bacterium]
MDVAEWLAGLGLARYADAFAAHAVDAELLATLTAEDLAAIGVVSVGHRRKLLNAIAALRGGRASRAWRSTRSGAERRPLTIMFVDLV